MTWLVHGQHATVTRSYDLQERVEAETAAEAIRIAKGRWPHLETAEHRWYATALETKP